MNNTNLQNIVKNLTEALPYIHKFQGKTFVVKYGGNAMESDSLQKSFAKDVALLKALGMNVVVVHGGGPQINNMLSRLNIQSEFIDGLRKTTSEIMDVVEMVLSGSINKSIVSSINNKGGLSIGLTGKDAKLLQVKRMYAGVNNTIDIGYVGEVVKVNTKIINSLLEDDIIPVIAPIGIDEFGQAYNVNADYAAASIASAMDAEKFILLSNITGVTDKDGNLFSKIHTSEIDDLINDKTIHGGMLPKIRCCMQAINNGAKSVHIIDGRIEHSVLLEIFTDVGIGTQITSA